MIIQSPTRVLLVTLATFLLWRVGLPTWAALLSLGILVAGWLLEGHLIAGFQLAGGGDSHPGLLAGSDRIGRLVCAERARWWSFLVGGVALAAWVAALIWPGRIRLEPSYLLLALAHATAFRTAGRLTWPSAAISVGRAWRSQIEPAALARLVAAATVVLPKRGFLTEGRPRIDQVETFVDELRPEDVLRCAAALLRAEPSALSRALQHAARRARLALPNVGDYQVLPGFGRAGTLDHTRCYLGGKALAEHLGQALPELSEEILERQVRGGTMLVLLDDERPLGLLAIEDEVRPEAQRLLDDLRQGGVTRICVLTDDEPEAAEETRRRFQLDEVMPQVAEDQAAAVVRQWAQRGPVAVVARPATAAAALAAADVAVPVVGPQEPVPEYATLAIRVDDPGRLPAAWLAVRDSLARDQRLARGLLVAGGGLVLLALLAVPLPLLLALDEGLVLLLLGGYLRRAKAAG